jgi:hypothetical protein
MNKSVLLRVSITVLFLIKFGCERTEPTTIVSESVCIAGETQLCYCTSDIQGVQLCKEEMNWSACACDTSPTDDPLPDDMSVPSEDQRVEDSDGAAPIILDGREDTAFLYESVVEVNNVCTGTLITNQAILTAAHCVCDSDDPPYNEDCQSSSNVTFHLASGTVEMNATVTIHPDEDLAVLTLDECNSTLQPRELATSNPAPNDGVTIVGFGANGCDGNPGYGRRRFGAAVVSAVTARLIKTNDDGSLVWKGDSGGPLLFNGQVAGVAHTARCGDLGNHILVSAYSAWIAANAEVDDSCQTPAPSCPSANGRYCGESVGLTPGTLYSCQNGEYTALMTCDDGCEIMSSGTNDECACSDPSYEAYCLNSEVWERNRCGDEQLVESCDYGCENATCLCQSNFERQCNDGDVYWFNSCGVREQRAEVCNRNEICANGQCIESERAYTIRVDPSLGQQTLVGPCDPSSSRALYVAEVNELNLSTNTTSLTFSKCDDSPPSQDLSYWVVVGELNPTNDTVCRAASCTRETGTWSRRRQALRVDDISVWPSITALEEAECGATKNLYIVTDGRGVEGERTWYQRRAAKFTKSCE